MQQLLLACYFAQSRKEIDSPVSPAGKTTDCLILFVPSQSHVLAVARSATHKNKRQDMVYDRSQFFFILNDISKEKNLTFILKIPTRLTGIKSICNGKSQPPVPVQCTYMYTYTHTHTQAVPGYPLQGVPGPTVLPVELR